MPFLPDSMLVSVHMCKFAWMLTLTYIYGSECDFLPGSVLVHVRQGRFNHPASVVNSARRVSGDCFPTTVGSIDMVWINQSSVSGYKSSQSLSNLVYSWQTLSMVCLHKYAPMYPRLAFLCILVNVTDLDL